MDRTKFASLRFVCAVSGSGKSSLASPEAEEGQKKKGITLPSRVGQVAGRHWYWLGGSDLLLLPWSARWDRHSDAQAPLLVIRDGDERSAGGPGCEEPGTRRNRDGRPGTLDD
ncbi:hypothetical protein B0T11DRAFT_299932 [Plectosphaerella cucumerina]|uniref:Uncharacterized protein n=1 Tax=Plectosphaerella cucumerina TaxID=40658 RepID=A0A8K0TC84_9PEZI|nr:hypothetical protein B0T11DRAFT_299932 [Plectosphaerella cucumerina]